MTPIMMNALLPGLLMAACLSVFADEPRIQSSFSTEGTSSPTYSTLSAPSIEKVDASGAQGEELEALGRSSADSMHSKAGTDSQVADDYKVNTLRNNTLTSP